MSIINTPFCSICETSKNCVWKPSTKYFINSLIFILPRYFFLQQSAILHFWDHSYWAPTRSRHRSEFCKHTSEKTDQDKEISPKSRNFQCNAKEMKWNEIFFFNFHDSIFIFAIKKLIQLSLQNMNNAFLIFKIMSIYSQFFLQQICCFALTSFWPAICILKSLVVSQ